MNEFSSEKLNTCLSMNRNTCLSKNFNTFSSKEGNWHLSERMKSSSSMKMKTWLPRKRIHLYLEKCITFICRDENMYIFEDENNFI